MRQVHRVPAIAASVAILISKLASDVVVAHPGCYTENETPTLEVTLEFCPLDPDGACCTPTQEADAIAVYGLYGPLSAACGELYQQIACAPCSAYAGHLYERLGAELGLADGVTMKSSFCEELVATCAGEIDFPTYGTEDYCEKHVGGEEDLLWSYPIDPSETTFESTGLVKAFENLPDTELPEKLIAMHMTPDGDFWWLAGQTGELKEISSDDPTSATDVLDLTTGVSLVEAFEEGLLDFALDPNFSNNNFFYCSYTVLIGTDRINRLAKFERLGTPAATKATLTILLDSLPKSNTIHSAGWVGFKPSDYGSSGMHDLYWAVGDGGPQEDTLGRGNDDTNILGSIVRISVSSDSDVVDLAPSGNRNGAVCASGFRNPFRCGFDSQDDTLYCGDVGHTQVEEIDLITCGNDYGWSIFEGSRCQVEQEDRIGTCAGRSRAGYTFPMFEYCHPNYPADPDSVSDLTGGVDVCGARAIEGLAVIVGHPYHGQRFNDVLMDALIFADAQKGNLYYLTQEGDEWVPGTIINDNSASIISFSEDNAGEIYVISAERIPYQLPCGDLCAKTCLDQEEVQPIISSLGCFADSSADRVLSLSQGDTCAEGLDLMSPAICAAYCATISGATLFGVEFAYECFCGSSADDYDRQGSLPSESCATICTGTPDEFCGGRGAIEIYSFSDGIPETPSPLPVISPTPVFTGGYTFEGCYADLVTNRVLSSQAALSSDVTIELCAEACEGSTYFGTEFGLECFCSVAGDDPTELGTATCTFPCAGDASQTCGARDAISVYSYSDDPAPTPTAPTPTPPTPTPTTPTSTGYAAEGCFGDSQTARVFPTLAAKSDDMTTEVCAGLCDGFTYFGTQYAHECWCGGETADFTLYGAATCDAPCEGDTSQTCGGTNALSVYTYGDGAPSPTPTTTTVDPATFQGCYANSRTSRVMGSLLTSATMTLETCLAHCATSIYYGLEYGTQCWCSDTTSYEAIGTATNCDFECAGDSTQICGGYLALSVYENVG